LRTNRQTPKTPPHVLAEVISCHVILPCRRRRRWRPCWGMECTKCCLLW